LSAIRNRGGGRASNGGVTEIDKVGIVENRKDPLGEKTRENSYHQRNVRGREKPTRPGKKEIGGRGVKEQKLVQHEGAEWPGLHLGFKNVGGLRTGGARKLRGKREKITPLGRKRRCFNCKHGHVLPQGGGGEGNLKHP